MAELEISPTKVGYVIVKARECAAKVAAWDDGASTEHDADSILEAFSEDATLAELKGFIRDLNEDEQASLVALAWIGRGSYAPEELDEALKTARAERINRTEEYLLGMPCSPTISRKPWTGSAIRSRTPRTKASKEASYAFGPAPSASAIARLRARPDRAPDRTAPRRGRYR